MEQKDFFSQMKGSQSLSFQKPPYILASGNVVGKKEGEGPLGKEFDVICEDDASLTEGGGKPAGFDGRSLSRPGAFCIQQTDVLAQK